MTNGLDIASLLEAAEEDPTFFKSLYRNKHRRNRFVDYIANMTLKEHTDDDILLDYGAISFALGGEITASELLYEDVKDKVHLLLHRVKNEVMKM